MNANILLGASERVIPARPNGVTKYSWGEGKNPVSYCHDWITAFASITIDNLIRASLD